MKSTAIILSAGQGKRMQSATAKQYSQLNGKPVLYYSLAAFSATPEIDNIIVVISESDRDFVEKEIIEKHQFTKVTDIINGGNERYHSVYNGLKAPGADESDFIFIHDGARPMIDTEIISRAAAAVKEHPAIVVGMPVKDTIKRVDGKNMVCETPNRETLWACQTPQVFAASLIKKAYRILGEREQELIRQGFIITDDAMLAETFTEAKVKLIPGSYRNIKITTPEDLKIAEALLKI
ncbi:MAG: 2-C-methyl-D-erythritol 4-phosphate cytidylyltransferase [Lachnospiraceae bacterium]|nr:2-C-methyl-D-erythritol 4-phosphate cytidylyltransferase [Lachnospiraceae bacterium]